MQNVMALAEHPAGAVQLLSHLLGALVAKIRQPDFCGDENIVPGDTRLSHRPAYLCLILVVSC